MKTVTEQQVTAVLQRIISEKEKQAKMLGESFLGVTDREVLSEMNKQLGTDWMLRKEQPVKFTKDDINAVANSRFYRKSGVKILLLWAIVVLIVLQAVVWFPMISIQTYYAMCGAVTVGFLVLYSKKQREVRRELWKGIEGDGVETEKK